MRAPVEVWILVWILLTQVTRLAVGVYNVNDFVPVVDTATGLDSETELDDNTRPRTDNRERDRDPAVATPVASQAETGKKTSTVDVEGPLRELINMDRDPVQCVELRSKRYISDGFCTSIRPITEVVCAGTCIPNPEWYSEYIKTYGNRKRKEWRCVNDSVRQKRVTLLCDNDTTRTYRIKTVKTCKCKRLQSQHNQSHRLVEAVSASRSGSNRNRRNRNNRQ